MAITDDLRKTLTDPTPFYFAAGTADLAVQQAKKVPALIEQLKPGGRMVLPMGPSGIQKLTVVDKDAAGRVELRKLIPVRFSPLETVL